MSDNRELACDAIRCWLLHEEHHDSELIEDVGRSAITSESCTECGLKWHVHHQAGRVEELRVVRPPSALHAAFNPNVRIQWPLDPVTLLGMLA